MRLFSLNRLSLLAIVSFCFVAVSALAEVPQVGRLQNGKPFRIDAQGVKITDQLAELEVENNDLRRQLIVLEDQLKGKPQPMQVANSQAACPACPTAPSRPANNCPQTNCPQVTCPQASCPATDCTASVKPYQDVASKAEKATENLQTSLTETRAQLAAKDADMAALSGDLTQAKRRMEELERLVSAEQNRNEQLVAQLEQTEKQTEKTVQMARAETRLTPPISPPAPPAKHNQARGSLGTDTPNVLAADELENAPAPTVSDRSLAEVQSSLRTQLSKVQSLIIARKNLLDRVKSSQKGISIQIQSLSSTKGRSLDTLRVIASRSSDVAELEQSERELGEIAAKLQSDIGILTRLVHL